MTEKKVGDVSALKAQGNIHFKACRFAEAAKEYQKAESQSPQDPVFSSNFSAALYELGDYLGCFQAICRAAKTAFQLKETDHSSLLLKLSSRLPKALTQGIWSGTIRSAQIEEEKQVVERLRFEGKAIPETLRLWEQMERVKVGAMSISVEDVATAKHRLLYLPIYKKAAASTKEFFSIGHDDILSIFDNWGALDDDQDPIDPKTLTPAECGDLSFLFAGVGDARHAFGSIIGLRKAYSTFTEPQKEKFHAHFTLLDIHPTALARDLCVMLLLDDLISGGQSPSEKEETMATIFYTFSAVLMPGKCAKRLQQIAQRLGQLLKANPPQLPPWIHVHSGSIPGLLASLEHWKTAMPHKTVAGMLMNHQLADANFDKGFLANPIIDAGFTSKLDEKISEERQGMYEYLDGLSEDELITFLSKHVETPCPKENLPQKRAKWIKDARETTVDILMDLMHEAGAASDNVELIPEVGWYREFRVFVPPRSLQGKCIAEVWSEVDLTCVDEVDDEIEKTWKPNASLFDAWDDLPQPHCRGYPNFMRFDAFQLIQAVYEFNIAHCGLDSEAVQVDKDCPSFSIVSFFFNGVVDAFRTLKGKIKWEVLQGDMCQTLVKMRLGDERPASFPRKYMRMWLSNVPDYTHGPMNTAIYISPNLSNHVHSAAASNCLLNTGIWASPDDFCHTYTLLSTADVPRFLGCQAKHMVPVYGLVSLAPLPQPCPLPLSQLASRNELTHWLTRVLLYTITSSNPQMESIRVMYPNNLVSFLNLLLHLHSVGFPGHWLSEFLNDVLNDQLMSTATVYRGVLPIPVSEAKRVVPKRRLFLDPWKVEWENILSIAYGAFSFPIHIPQRKNLDGISIRSLDDIGRYQVTLGYSKWCFPTAMRMRLNTDQCIVLVFLRPSTQAQHSADYLAAKMADVVEGRVTKADDMYILTAVDELSMESSRIAWRMYKGRVEKMKREKWVMVPIRFDAQEAVTSPIAASAWEMI